ncbi:hypothetical protein ACTMTF_36765 [Nonomuraea sp. ZG12]|uniref:hypothetical protein n=1 Tax=Nonomuraea sp. ZG12 TaxID=3452207 RepID=UPI003F8CBF5D
MRRVLAVKPEGPWLVLVSGSWNVATPDAKVDTPFIRSRLWLLPLLKKPRDEVESHGRQALGPDGPDIAEALRAVIECGLTGPSEYWVARALTWIIADEVELFAEPLQRIAVGQCSQATRHAAKRLLKQKGLWSTHTPCDGHV